MEVVPWTYNNPRVERRKLEKQEFLFQGRLLEIAQDTSIEIDVNKNTAFKLWDGGYLLSRHIENQTIFPLGYWKGKKCIEVGAGCGLVGQVAWLLGAQVTLTDLAEALHHTQKCLDRNLYKFPELNQQTIQTLPYAWGAGTENIDAPCDVILASDVIYSPKLAKYLVKAFSELANEKTLILVSYKPRGLGENITFDMLKRAGFVIETVDRDQHPREFMDSGYDISHIKKSEE